MGYLAGIALLGTGLKLKANYTNYSAILVSGAMAIFYFITYLAYSFYGLIPQSLAFAMMVLFTIFTVLAALTYDRQVIAHIGLVGAYGVPFLLGDDSGNVTTLFTYMSIINIGILLIAFRKNWKILQYVAFLLTWLIYFQWYESTYRQDEYFATAFTFLSIFFVIFYAISLGFQLFQKEKLERLDLALLLLNAFIFYGLGYGLLNRHGNGQELLGLYTIGNAGIHFLVSAFLYQRKLVDRNLFYLVSGLVLVLSLIHI